MNSSKKAITIAGICIDKKADDVRVLDLRKITALADFFVICSAFSLRRAQAIKEALEASALLKNQKILHEEGARDGKWIVIDYGDVIAHILYEPVRKFYDLDRLWGDAEPVEIK